MLLPCKVFPWGPFLVLQEDREFPLIASVIPPVPLPVFSACSLRAGPSLSNLLNVWSFGTFIVLYFNKSLSELLTNLKRDRKFL